MHLFSSTILHTLIKPKDVSKRRITAWKKLRVKSGYGVSRLARVLCCRGDAMGEEVCAALYFYGPISRETAEWILWDAGCRDGMFLLRESSADYVLSLCFQKSVLHYRIRRLSSGAVGLCGQRFPGPVELVRGVEGLACRPSVPCNRGPSSTLPLTHWGCTEEQIKKAILRKAREWGIDEEKLDSSLTENYNDVKLLITKTLHEIQPWFHGILSRVEAERHIEDSGHKDGKFLVRERDDSSYALCLSHSGRIKHYKIDVLPSGEFAIQDGQRFPSIMALVSHYTLFSDGLWCQLQDPCIVPPRRPNDGNFSQIRSRTLDGHGSNNQRHHIGSSGGNSLDRNRVSGLRRSSTGSSPSSKASRFLNSLNQRKLFSKLFSTVAPNRSSNPSTSRSCLSLSDDNVDMDHAINQSERINLSTPPPTRLIGEEERKGGGLQKASSFDFLPAFLSLFIYGDGSSVKNDSKKSDISHRKTKVDCNGSIPSTLPRTFSIECRKSLQSAPVPAPRLSLARKAVRDPVYANRDILSFTGRSASLGEQAGDSEIGDDLEDGVPVAKVFCRSASSPSVTQSAKTRPLVPHIPLRLSCSEGSGKDCQYVIPLIPGGPFSRLVQPVPKPRLNLPNSEKRSVTSCDSCASVDSSTSPTLTEGSEFGQESLPDDSPPSHSPARVPDPDEISLMWDPDDDRTGRLLPNGTCPLDDLNNQVYATLSSNSNTLCLLSGLPVPPSSAAANNHCPEGILVDLGVGDEMSRESSELAYLTLRECRKGPLNLDYKTIDLKDKIASGLFCDVYRGVYSSGTVEVQFAVKTLKSNTVPNPRSEILKEAQMMVALDHPHIVRLIGVSDNSSLMLVMELAPLGPLSNYLKIHREISMNEIIVLMLQVATAMEYLEEKQFVHRDLAARNVLLVNESFVKISDLGMSRALGLGKEYYRAETAGKWPLRWYAPECIYYFKFSSKSDVWSFGVTLWEAVSYGEKPYLGMLGRDILMMFERNERLPKPESCSDSMYELMRKCWRYRAEDRPTFTEICNSLRGLVTT